MVNKILAVTTTAVMLFAMGSTAAFAHGGHRGGYSAGSTTTSSATAAYVCPHGADCLYDGKCEGQYPCVTHGEDCQNGASCAGRTDNQHYGTGHGGARRGGCHR